MDIYDDDRDHKLWLEAPSEACENFCIESTSVPELSSIGVLALGGGLLWPDLSGGNPAAGFVWGTRGRARTTAAGKLFLAHERGIRTDLQAWTSRAPATRRGPLGQHCAGGRTTACVGFEARGTAPAQGAALAAPVLGPDVGAGQTASPSGQLENFALVPGWALPPWTGTGWACRRRAFISATVAAYLGSAARLCSSWGSLSWS